MINKKVNVVSNLATLSGLSSFSRSFVKAMTNSFTIQLPEFGKSSIPGIISTEDISTYVKLLKIDPADITINIGLPYTWDTSIPNSIGIFGHGCNRINARDLVMHPSFPPERYNWVKQCNKMSQIWTFSQASKASITNSGVTVPVKVIPGFIDTDFWKSGIEELPDGINGISNINGVSIPKDKRRFVVGHCGEFSQRKDVFTFLKTCMVGLPFDEIVILLKTYPNDPSCRPGMILDSIAKFKQSLKLPKLPSIIVIDDPLSDIQMRDVIGYCDVYVSLSRGDALDRCTLEAMSMGKPVIVSNAGAHPDYIKHETNGFLIDVSTEIVCNQDDPINGVSLSYFGDQLWGKVLEIDFLQKLQSIFQMWKTDRSLKQLDTLKSEARSTVVKLHGLKPSRTSVEREVSTL